MTYRYIDANREKDPTQLPDVEVFHSDANDSDGAIDEPGWYFAFGFPGCLWDDLPEGPHADETEALTAARESAGFCEHGHDADDHHPCNDCEVDRADGMADLKKEGD